VVGPPKFSYAPPANMPGGRSLRAALLLVVLPACLLAQPVAAVDAENSPAQAEQGGAPTATDPSAATEEQSSKGVFGDVDEDDGSWTAFFKRSLHLVAHSHAMSMGGMGGMHFGHPGMLDKHQEFFKDTLRRQAEYTPWGGFSTPVLEGIAIAVVMVAFVGGSLALIIWNDLDDSGTAKMGVADSKKTDGDPDERISEAEAFRIANEFAWNSYGRF